MARGEGRNLVGGAGCEGSESFMGSSRDQPPEAEWREDQEQHLPPSQRTSGATIAYTSSAPTNQYSPRTSPANMLQLLLPPLRQATQPGEPPSPASITNTSSRLTDRPTSESRFGSPQQGLASGGGRARVGSGGGGSTAPRQAGQGLGLGRQRNEGWGGGQDG